MNDKTLYVFVYLDGKAAILAGILSLDTTPRSESASFRYVKSYVENPAAIPVDPFALPLPAPGPASTQEFATRPGFSLFGAIGDAIPDSWGRFLMEDAARRPLKEWEFLLAGGEFRPGNLDFGESPDAPSRLQPWNDASLPESEDFSEGLSALLKKYEGDTSSRANHLRKLIDRGSSLGGSRPKATVLKDGKPFIAKFNTREDIINNARVEYATMLLAKDCGITVPNLHLDSSAGRDVFLIERFDRETGNDAVVRLGMYSGMTMFEHLTLSDARHDRVSYRDILDRMRPLPGTFDEALHKELFRRMVFNILCGNSDDHLRNFAFLRRPSGNLALSPAYDIMPQLQAGHERSLILIVGNKGTEASIENALSWATAFSYRDRREAEEEVRRMLKVARHWKKAYSACGVSERDIDALTQGQCYRDRDLKAL